MSKPAVIFALAIAALASAQDTAPKLEIQGTVIEAGANRGLSGAQLLLTVQGEAQPVAQTFSDSDGAFHFEPAQIGHYAVQVKMEGYRALIDTSYAGLANAIVGFGDMSRNVVLTRGNPKETLRFTMLRPAQISGRVLDEETLKPVAKVPVVAAAPGYRNGQRIWNSGSRAVTDDDGQFVIPNLVPGSYLVATLPLSGGGQLQAQFSPADAAATDHDYEVTYWPSGRDMDSAALVQVDAGALASTGSIRIRKTELFRLRGSLAAANCDAGTMAQIMFQSAIPGPTQPSISAQVVCGQDFLIRGVQPGSYRLSATRGRAGARVQASVPVTVADRNVEAALTLAPGTNLDGRIVAAEGAGQLPLDRLIVFVQALDAAAAGAGPYNPDEQGRFEVPNIAPGRETVFFENLGGFYVQEIRYNGQPVSNNTFTVAADSSARSIEIVLDDKPGTISGAVDDGGQAVSRPYVVLAAWPPPAGDMAPAVKNATGGDDGHFRFTGLPPGEYRLLAVPQDSKSDLDPPGVLQRLLSSAEKVTLSPGALQDVHLKPTSLR